MSRSLRQIASGGLQAVLKLNSTCSSSYCSTSTLSLISHLVSQFARFQSYHLESFVPSGNSLVTNETSPSGFLCSFLIGSSPFLFGVLSQSGDGMILPNTESLDSKISMILVMSCSLPFLAYAVTLFLHQFGIGF